MDTIPDSTPQKQCTSCKRWKPATVEYFHAHKNSPLGIRAKCKECSHTKGGTRRRSRPCDADGNIQCSKCKQWKPATTEHFFVRKNRKNGFCSSCKGCSKLIGERHEYVPNVDVPMLQCSKCREFKPATLEYFARYARARRGLRSMCKICQQKAGAIYRPSHKEQTKISGRRRYLSKRDEIISKGKIYYAAHREHHLEVVRQYRITHVEWHRWYTHHYGRKHQQEKNARTRSYRARKRSIPGTHTSQQVQEQYLRQHKKCYYCGNHIKWGKHHVDHTFPISRVAGTNIPANDISYLVITCQTCNLKKGNKYPWEWPEGGKLL